MTTTTRRVARAEPPFIAPNEAAAGRTHLQMGQHNAKQLLFVAIGLVEQSERFTREPRAPIQEHRRAKVVIDDVKLTPLVLCSNT